MYLITILKGVSIEIIWNSFYSIHCSSLAQHDRFIHFPSFCKQPRSGFYTVGDFMTRKEELHVVKSTTTVDEALEMLVENRITGFPVIDEDWKLVLTVPYTLLLLFGSRLSNCDQRRQMD